MAGQKLNFRSANLISNEYSQLLEKQNAIYEEKEKEKKKKIEENQINNQNVKNILITKF